ncbi:MAG: RMD1 family protein [Ignavibacteriales bacterium]
MKITIAAYQIAESLNIKLIKNEFAGDLIDSSSFDLFYKVNGRDYLFLLDYGVVVFAGFNDLDISKTLSFLQKFTQNYFEEKLTEDYQVSDGAPKYIFSYNSLQVPQITNQVLKITMLNVGQSVGLDYYSALTQNLLNETTNIYETLEKEGKFSISKKKLLQFIGKSMNIKKKIIDNIYILDEPEFTWEDEAMNNLNFGLRDAFDIRKRFRELDYQLQIIIDNLHMLMELLHNRESSRLEWIIIVLILFEVVHLIVSQILF